MANTMRECWLETYRAKRARYTKKRPGPNYMLAASAIEAMGEGLATTPNCMHGVYMAIARRERIDGMLDESKTSIAMAAMCRQDHRYKQIP